MNAHNTEQYIVTTYLDGRLDLSDPIFASDVSDYTLFVTARMTNFTFVNLSGCREVSESGIAVLVQSSPNITHFIMRNASLRGRTIQQVLSLKHLEVFDLEESHLFSNAGLTFNGCENSLKTLTISEPLSLNWSALTAIEALSVGRVSPEDIIAISETCKTLRTLTLTKCNLMSGSFKHMSQATRIEFRDCSLSSLSYWPPRAPSAPLIDVVQFLPNLR